MALVIREIHTASNPELLNDEWLLIENTGPGLLNSSGWSLLVGKQGPRPHQMGTLQPGFIINAGEKMRLVTGSPGKKAYGAPPPEGDGVKNYFLFLRKPVLDHPGLIIHLAFHQLELAHAIYAPDKPNGIATD